MIHTPACLDNLCWCLNRDTEAAAVARSLPGIDKAVNRPALDLVHAAMSSGIDVSDPNIKGRFVASQFGAWHDLGGVDGRHSRSERRIARLLTMRGYDIRMGGFIPTSRIRESDAAMVYGWAVDMVIPDRMIVIEVDGPHHAGRERSDLLRTFDLWLAGWMTLRIRTNGLGTLWRTDILANPMTIDIDVLDAAINSLVWFPMWQSDLEFYLAASRRTERV